MPITAKHVFTSPVADGTNTQIVRPSDWNSGHLITFSPSGGELIGAFSNSGNVSFGTNTAGYVTASAAAGGGVALSAGTNSTSTGTVVFSNANGLTFGMNTNGAVTGSYTVPTVPAQTEYVFSNGNGVSFGTAGSTVTATVKTDYLTTARASNDAIGLNTALTGNGVSVTANSSGLSINVPAFLTTAAQSNHSHNFATTTTNGASIVVGTTNSNGVTIGVPSYLTTAAQSNHSHNLATTTTNGSQIVVGTTNSAGATIGVPPFITTYVAQTTQTQPAGNIAGVGSTFNGTNISGSITQNSNGLRLDLSVGAGGAADGYNSAQFTNSTANSTMPLVWAGNSNGSGNVTMGLTGSTVTMSAPTAGGAGVAISAGANSQNTGTVAFSNSNGISFGLNAGTVTASYTVPTQTVQPVAYSAANGSANFSTLTFANSNGVSFSTGTQGLYATVKTDYLTTARASNDAVGLNTALTANGVAWTVNSSGISLNVPAFLTTAAQVSHSHGNPTLALTNITGTTASASNGLTLSLSGVAAQTTQTQPAGNIAGVGTTFGGTNVSGSMTLNSNGLALSLSAPTPGGGGAVNVSAGTTSGNLQTIQFNNANGVSFGLNGSTVTASVNAAGGGAKTLTYFDVLQGEAAGATVGMSSRVSQASTIWLFPLDREGFPGDMTVQTAMFNVFNSGNTNSISAAMTYTWGLGIYQVTDVTRLTLIRKASSVWTQSANANYSQSLVGQRWLTFHSTQFSNATGGAANLELAAGGRYVGALSVSSAGSAMQTHNFLGEYLYSTAARSGHMGVLSATGTSKGFHPWVGQFSATSSAFPGSIGYNQINRQVASGNFRPHLVFNNLGDLG